MLGPAVNRQPGFRRGLVEQSNAEKNNPVDWRAGLARAGCFGLPGCLADAGWCWQAAGPLPGWLTGWLPGSLARSTWLAPASWLAVACPTGLLAGRVAGCMAVCLLTLTK